MSAPVFIGDEVSAQGYRLAGLEVLVPQAGELPAMIRRACQSAPLVLIDAALAERLPVAQLDVLLAVSSPPVLVAPAVRGTALLPDIASRLRRQLGVLE